MRTPTRKIGKYAHLKPDPNMTEAKFGELKKSLERLKKAQPSAIAEVKRLALMGDFSENAAYSIAKGRLRGINQRVLDIENQLKLAEIIKPKHNKTVELGHTVTVEINKKIKTFQILGSTETEPSSGIISHNSPLGSALMHKQVGDIAKVPLKEKIIEYKIIKIK